MFYWSFLDYCLIIVWGSGCGFRASFGISKPWVDAQSWNHVIAHLVAAEAFRWWIYGKVFEVAAVTPRHRDSHFFYNAWILGLRDALGTCFWQQCHRFAHSTWVRTSFDSHQILRHSKFQNWSLAVISSQVQTFSDFILIFHYSVRTFESNNRFSFTFLFPLWSWLTHSSLLQTCAPGKLIVGFP